MSNRPNQQIKPHPTRLHHPLITYLSAYTRTHKDVGEVSLLTNPATFYLTMTEIQPFLHYKGISESYCTTYLAYLLLCRL